MIKSFSVKNIRFYVGARAALREPTALFTLHLVGEPTDWPATEAMLRREVLRFWPSEPVPGLGEADWPHALLIEQPQSGIAAWVVALTIACQRLARDPVGRGSVIGDKGSMAELAVPYVRESVMRESLTWALRWLALWLPPPNVSREAKTPQLKRAFEKWLHAVQPGGLVPNTLRFALAARVRGIPVNTVGNGIVQFGWGANALRMESSFTANTSVIGTRIARNKNLTSKVLALGGLPVPSSGLAATFDQARQIATQLGWPVVIKPSNQDQGNGVVPDIRDTAMLQTAFIAAAKYSPGAVIVEKHIPGDDHRMLVVGSKLIMTTRRIPGGVTGDGMLTIGQLVDAVNADPRRGAGKRSLMITLTLDDEAQTLMTEQGLSKDAIPDSGHFVRLRRTANLSTGGTPQDVSNTVHPDNRLVAERAARLVGLDIAGVDFLCPDISRSWREVGGGVCEVNAQPGFRPHWLGDPSRDINAEVVDWLFKGKSGRIPTAAITGTNGKSTTARMLHHIWMSAGKNAGVCTTSGVWVGHDLVSDHNLSGYPGARMLLDDPAVEAAVIEMPRKGLIHFGHPCDRYDVAALLNVQDDHIGEDGIHTLEGMARLKAEVLARAQIAVVVNADDPLCLAMLAFAGSPRHILVARTTGGFALQTHLAQAGEAVFTQVHEGQSWIVLARGAAQTPLMPMADIPATMNGLLKNNESNALFAAALAWAHCIRPEIIREALAGFSNTHAQNPGRYNFVKGFPFQLLLDYAHNPDGIQTLCQVVTQIPAKKRIAVCLTLGNRSAAHIQLAAPALANCFDQFILGQDATRVLRCADYGGDDPKGKMLQYFFDQMLRAGIAENKLVVERDPSAAILRGLACAEPGDLLVLMTESEIAMPLLVVKQTDYDCQ